MSDPVPPTFEQDALEHLRSLQGLQMDPDLREWRAPSGVLASPEGLTASFRAMRMRSVVDARAGEIRFEAWRNPRAAGAVLAAVLGASLYVLLSWLELQTGVIVFMVVLAAFYVPIAVLPSYRVSGSLADGRVQVRLQVRGLFGRRGALERRLRFYLER